MTHCVYCLGPLPDNVAFCPSCGKRIEAGSPAGYEKEVAYDPDNMAEKIPAVPPQALWSRIAGETPRPAAPADTVPPPPPPARKNNGGKIIGVVAALALVVAGVFVLWPSGDDDAGGGQTTAASGKQTTAKGQAGKSDQDAMDILESYGLAGLKVPEGATMFSNGEYVEKFLSSSNHAVTVRGLDDEGFFSFVRDIGAVGAANGITFYANSMSGGVIEEFAFVNVQNGAIYVYDGQQYMLVISRMKPHPFTSAYQENDVMLTFSLSTVDIGGGS